VTEDAFAAGRAAGRGEYQALCGPVFTPTAMIAPPGRRCPECWDILAVSHQAAAPATSRRPRHRRPGLLRRLLLMGTVALTDDVLGSARPVVLPHPVGEAIARGTSEPRA
jgi:hypothetical protein